MTEKCVSEISPEYLVAVSKSGVPVGYKQTEIGVIPDDWKIATIGDTCELLTGFPFPSSSYADSGVRLLRGSNVKRGCTDWSDDLTQYWPEVTSTLKQYELMAGDIVISMDGSLVGRSFAQLNEADLPALLLQRVARVRSSSVSQNYLKEWICSKFFTEHCDSVKTVTAIPHISPQDIRTFKFLLPISNEEQTAIANALSDVDALIQELEKLIAKTQAIKTATMQQLLTGRTRLPQFAHHPDGRKKGYKPSELGEIPEDWEVVNLGEISAITKLAGFEYTNYFNSYRDGGDIIVIRGTNITENFLDLNDIKTIPRSTSNMLPRSQLNAGDLVFAYVGTVGPVFLIREDNKYHLGPNTAKITCNNTVVSEFLRTYFTSELIKIQIDEHLSIGAQPSLSMGKIRSFKIVLPCSKDEQIQIDTVISSMEEEIQSLKTRINKTRQIKQGMMQELLTGKTRLVKPAGAA